MKYLLTPRDGKRCSKSGWISCYGCVSTKLNCFIAIHKFTFFFLKRQQKARQPQWTASKPMLLTQSVYLVECIIICLIKSKQNIWTIKHNSLYPGRGWSYGRKHTVCLVCVVVGSVSLSLCFCGRCANNFTNLPSLSSLSQSSGIWRK